MYMKVLSNRKNIDQIKSYEGRGTTPQKEKYCLQNIEFGLIFEVSVPPNIDIIDILQ